MSDEPNLRLEWRIALRTKWVTSAAKGGYGAPRGKDWRSLSGQFNGFLLYLGDVADNDGACRKFLPSQAKVADFLRCERETVRLYYQAAEAAGIIRLTHSPKGQINGFQLTFPLGGKPRWDEARDVLHNDRRAVHFRHQQALKELAEQEVVSADATSTPYEVVSADTSSVRALDRQVVSADDPKWCQLTDEVVSADTTTRSSRRITDMAEGVSTGADPRARGMQEDEIPGQKKDDEQPARPTLLTEADVRARSANIRLHMREVKGERAS